MPGFKRREPSSSSSSSGGKRESKPKASKATDKGGSAPAPSPGLETAALEQWLAPSTSSAIDQIDLGDIDEGWEPERVGQAPLDATLAAIQAVGVVEPVLLRPRDGGRFEVVTGHRTVAAARAAGMPRVPAVVKDLDDAGALMALVFDGSASGQVTAAGAAELRSRLAAAGAGEEDIEDVMAAVPVAEGPAEIPVAAAEEAAVAELVGTPAEPTPAAEAEVIGEELVPVAEPMLEAPAEQPEVAEVAPEPVAAAPEPEVVEAAPEPEPVGAAEPEMAAPEPQPIEVGAPVEAPPEPEPIEAPAELEPAAVAEPEIPEAAPELEPVGAAEPEAPEATPEPQPIEVGAPPEPEPIEAPAELEPVAAAAATPTPEPALAGARTAAPEGATAASTGRWLPLPAGRPRLARLSSAFADAPRMLRILAGDRFTGTAELVGRDGRKDAVAFLDGRILATYVEQGERRVDAPLRLPSPDQGPTVEITVRPHPRAVSVALALALRSPARFTGLDAAFLHLDGLLDLLRRERSDAACVVTSRKGSGVILLDAGQPIAAYARRSGDEPGEEAETTDVSAVLDMLVSGDGTLDVHTGDVPEPLDLDDVVARALAGG